jgi:chromatin remodeling complex protein RSC6
VPPVSNSGDMKKKLKNVIINPLNLNIKELKMAEAKGLSKPVKLKHELAEFLGATELPRTEITKKLWDYIKANQLQTKTENGKPENAGKFIVADAKLLPIFKNTKSTSKSGKVTDLTTLQEGQTVNMMQMAAIVGANIEEA